MNPEAIPETDIPEARGVCLECLLGFKEKRKKAPNLYSVYCTHNKAGALLATADTTPIETIFWQICYPVDRYNFNHLVAHYVRPSGKG